MYYKSVSGKRNTMQQEKQQLAIDVKGVKKVYKLYLHLHNYNYAQYITFYVTLQIDCYKASHRNRSGS